jgi:glutathione synthase/RimK-type ligase-like ATP-grasp enzyme
MSAKFALASARDIHPNGPEEDALILAALRERAADARIIVWDETEPASLAGTKVVIRTTWNYQDHFPKFIRWLEEIERADGSLVNPKALLLGTIDKRYLVDFRARGFAVPETIACTTSAELEAALKDNAFADAIIKPAVGAGAIGLRRVKAAQPDTWNHIDFAKPQLLQRFLPEIETGGELTFVFFGGAYSHAVRKRGKPGDIRVQVDWGGTVEVIEPSQALINQAAHFLTALSEMPTYARVDVVEVDGNLLLMELEVIEPELFCLYVPGTADRFADVLMAL